MTVLKSREKNNHVTHAQVFLSVDVLWGNSSCFQACWKPVVATIMEITVITRWENKHFRHKKQKQNMNRSAQVNFISRLLLIQRGGRGGGWCCGHGTVARCSSDVLTSPNLLTALPGVAFVVGNKHGGAEVAEFRARRRTRCARRRTPHAQTHTRHLFSFLQACGHDRSRPGFR